MSVNKVILIGRLGQDPEFKTTASQTAICSFSVATSERRKDASGAWVDHTEWHRISCFGRTAELCNTYLKKGRQVYIEGKLRTTKWQDKQGQDRYTTDVVALTVQFLGAGKGEATGSEGVEMESYQSAPQDSGHSAFSSNKAADAFATAPAKNEISFTDDDIPF